MYRLSAQLQGFKPAERTDINLRVDFTLRANIAMVPEAVQMEEQVVRTGTAPAVNIGSAEAGTIVSREFLATVPDDPHLRAGRHHRPHRPARLLRRQLRRRAPRPRTTTSSTACACPTPSYGTLGTNLLTNFVDQLDVKVGSFMPEYGYSSAGIINTVTKSGGNEFHGSIWGNLTPGFFTPSTPATGRTARRSPPRPPPTRAATTADFGVEVGGPIVKDKLWFYAGFAPQMNYNARTRYYQ